MNVLAADIGGTNTRVIFAEVNQNGRHIIVEKKYRSADFTDFTQVLEHCLSEHEITGDIDAACFAVAGPVKSGVAAITNLPWVVNKKELSHRFKIPKVKLINDFIAVAYGIDELTDLDTLTLQQGDVNSEKDKPAAVVIGAGTGLGIAHRVWVNGRYEVFSTEAGHAGFAPENEQQCRLLHWLQKKYSHVSLEMILSGRGLLMIYNFFREQEAALESMAVIDAMKKTDPAQVVTEYALSGSDVLCQKTLECFIDIYGAAAANAALYFYPVGEVYIAGGIGIKIKDKLQGQRFIDAFINKGLMSSNMEKITIKLILQESVGLYGALKVALDS